jgi:hypothetical protein
VNSVVIILVTHIDELMYGILLSISPSWVASMSLQQVPQSHIQQSPSQQSPPPKPPQTIAAAAGEHDEGCPDDDGDSLERETIPSEEVECKSKCAEVCEVESGAAVSIS